jgi:hypothetical protein
MFDTTVTTGPLSYSQSRDTFRPRRAVFRSARRTGLGRTAFVDFLERGSVRDRFIAELVPEGRPGCVVDALRHPGSGEFDRRHVADRDVIEAPHQIERELVLEIGTGIRDLCVQLRDMSLVLSCSLRFRQLFCRASAEPVIRQFFSGRKRGEVFQAEIDADTGADRADLHIGHLDHDVEKPVAARILRKIGPVLDLAFGKRSTVEHAEGVAGKAKRFAFALQVSALQRHPAQRFHAGIAQVRPTVPTARLRVLLARRVDRAGMDAERLAAAGRQHVQIKTRRPFLIPLERVLLRVVAEVPDVVHRTALLVEQSIERFHAVAIDKDHAGDPNPWKKQPVDSTPFLSVLKDGVSRSK